MDLNKLTPIINKPNGWALMPLVVFLCLYLVTSLIVNDFYKVPITVAFLVASVYAVATTKGLSLNDRILQYSSGAANKNIMLMLWIFILAGAFAQSAKAMGAIDAAVNLTICCWQEFFWLPVSYHCLSVHRWEQSWPLRRLRRVLP